MRRKFASYAISGFVLFVSWALPKYLEVNNVITLENSCWLLYSIYIGAFIVICVLVWGYWPEIKKKKVRDSLICNVYSQISGACHTWKNDYILYYPGHFSKGGGQYSDVWEHMEKTGGHVYSEQEWLKYRPLFDQVIVEVINKLIEPIKLFPDSIEEQFKMQVYQTIEQLKLERSVYLSIPSLILPIYDKDEDKNQAFKARFSGVIRCLSLLSREADKISAKNRPKK